MKSETKKKEVNVNEEILTYLDSRLNDSIQNTSAYAQKQERFYKLRMRLRNGKKSFPFEGASDLRQPTADTKIRKAKAALSNLIFGVRPVVQVIPGPSGNEQVARKVEKFLDHLIMDVMQTDIKSLIAIDQELEKGMYFIKPYWRTESTTRLETLKAEDFTVDEISMMVDPDVPEDLKIEGLVEVLEVDMSDRVQSKNLKALDEVLDQISKGEAEIKVTLWDEIYDAPDISLVSPEFLFVPSNSPFSVQECEFLCHEFFLPLRVVKANKDKGWEIEDVEELENFQSYDDRSLTNILKDRREGIERIKNEGVVKIHEIYCWYDLNGDGYDEKCVFTVLPDFDKVVRKITLPFKSGKWPFVKLVWEMIDDRFYASRGLVEIIEDIIKEIDIQHMQKIDQQTIRNNPMFVYRVGMVNPNMVKFLPNQGIPVKGSLDLKNVVDVLNANNPNVEMSYEREEQTLLGKVEELIGQMDFTLHNQINKREPRTLGEVNLQQQNMNTTFSMDAMIHTRCFGELFAWIWELWCEYGKDSYEFAYFGGNGAEKIKLTREEIQGKYKIVVRGNDQNTNPQVRIQKAQAILQGVLNPVALQTGISTPQQIIEGYAEYYQQLGVDNWQRFVNTKPQAPPQPEQPVVPSFADLTDGEKMQLLKRRGIEPDVDGRHLQKQQELMEASGGR